MHMWVSPLLGAIVRDDTVEPKTSQLVNDD